MRRSGTWHDIERYSPSWERRAAFAAKFIEPGSSVLDLGCGQMHLRKYLSDGCTYTPSDLRAWTDEVIICDLDAGQFPDGYFDVITLLGVLGFVKDTEGTLEKARKHAKRLVVTFMHPNLFNFRKRLPERVHHYTRKELATLIEAAGRTITKREFYHRSGGFSTWLYSCQ